MANKTVTLQQTNMNRRELKKAIRVSLSGTALATFVAGTAGAGEYDKCILTHAPKLQTATHDTLDGIMAHRPMASPLCRPR
jgi:hypothetical protein